MTAKDLPLTSHNRRLRELNVSWDDVLSHGVLRESSEQFLLRLEFQLQRMHVIVELAQCTYAVIALVWGQRPFQDGVLMCDGTLQTLNFVLDPLAFYGRQQGLGPVASRFTAWTWIRRQDSISSFYTGVRACVGADHVLRINLLHRDSYRRRHIHAASGVSAAAVVGIAGYNFGHTTSRVPAGFCRGQIGP